MKKKKLGYSSVEITDNPSSDLTAGESVTTHQELNRQSAADEGGNGNQTTIDPSAEGHSFSHEEIAYGAFCIYQEEQRKGKYSGKDAHWFSAIDRLTKIRAKKATPAAAKSCYRCGALDVSDEHVPPRCFFPEKKDLPAGVDYRKGLITVRSCVVHNAEKSRDDEYLLAVIAAYHGNNQAAQDHYGAKILRALRRSLGFAHCILDGSENVTLDGKPTKALPIDTPRFLRGLTNMAYGLYFDSFGVKCPHPMQVHTPALHGADKQQRQDVVGLVDSVRPLLADAPLKGANPEIFQFQVVQIPDNPITLIRMLFYQGVEVIAISAPGLEEVAEQ